MCLIVDKEEFKIEMAQEDIVVYKVLKKYDKDVVSPYQEFVYEIGKKYKTRMKPRLYSHYNYCEISEGFHSFLNEKDAKDEKLDIQYGNIRNKDLDLCCFRCVIPKGSKIVYGKYGAKDAIVSDTIKVVGEV